MSDIPKGIEKDRKVASCHFAAYKNGYRFIARIKKDAQASRFRQLVPYAGINLIRFTDPAFAISA
ncbi:hypothetical protein PMAN_a0229 [Pseudoalteromonas marina]|nr:hypothetical protein PMAN_a0229 [Pseudoalteromonas marina]